MLAWRIYYESGTVFSSDEGSPFDAPREGVLVIVSPDVSVGRYLLAKKEYYWWNEGYDCWMGGDLFGLFDHLRTAPRQCLLMGRFVSNAEFERAMAQALGDPEFEPKSAYLLAEVGRPTY